MNLITYVRVVKLIPEPDAAFLALGMFPRAQVMNGKVFLIKKFTLAYITCDAWVGFIGVLRIPI